MRTIPAISIFAAGLSLAAFSPTLAATVVPVDLRCESLQNPLGIGTVSPRLSWRLKALDPDARGQRQTAYRVLVAAREETLAGDQGDLWDTGKVASDQALHLVYAGRPLSSEQVCWWKVRVWDQDGEPSAWSEPARWSMGLLKADDWQAEWIGRDEPPPSASASPLVKAGAKWIWHPGENAATAAPIGIRFFRRTFDLPGDRAIRHAQLVLAGDNSFATAVNGVHAGQGSSFKLGVVMDVTKSLHAGRNVVAAWVKNAGETPNPAGLVGVLHVEFETGEPVVIPTDEQCVRWTATPLGGQRWNATTADGATRKCSFPWAAGRGVTSRWATKSDGWPLACCARSSPSPNRSRGRWSTSVARACRSCTSTARRWAITSSHPR